MTYQTKKTIFAAIVTLLENEMASTQSDLLFLKKLKGEFIRI